MKLSLISGLVLIGIITFFCKRDDISAEGNLFGKWEVTDFISIESRTYPKENQHNPIITFFKNGTYELLLDANNCGGDFIIQDRNKITINPYFCTERCCDSEFSLKLVSVLHDIGSFDIEQNGRLNLIVDGWGFVELNKVD